MVVLEFIRNLTIIGDRTSVGAKHCCSVFYVADIKSRHITDEFTLLKSNVTI